MSHAARQLKDPPLRASEYADDVIAERVVVCDLVRKAVEREVRDLKRSIDDDGFPYWFDDVAAAHAVRFFRMLKHSKGEWAGTYIELEPWQQFALWCSFGWKRDSDGSRRFRIVYEEVPRKNGKSTKGAGVGIYLLVADGEPGAEVYTAATKRDQARIVHSEAVRMVRASPTLSRRISTRKDNLHIEQTASKYEPLGADSDTLDGLNIHGAIIDELHAHKDRGMWDIVETGTASRRQPMLFAITTAGIDSESICGEIHDYAVQILDGTLEDESFFALIYGLDEGDDWADESVWIKANPNLRVSVKVDNLREQCAKAKATPAAQNTFRRLRMNEWVGDVSRFIDLAAWDRCAGELDPLGLAASLRGQVGYGGLDLASTTDLAAFVIDFPPGGERKWHGVLPFFWMPGDAADDVQKQRRDRVNYPAWVEAGLIKKTPGGKIDYDTIRADIEELADQFQIREIGYDDWGATQLSTQLENFGLVMVKIRQGIYSFSQPTKELSGMVADNEIRHGGHRVLRWMADNTIVRQDSNGNLMPDRKASRKKIDGIMAFVMAISRVIRHAPPDGPSVYEDEGRGLIVL